MFCRSYELAKEAGDAIDFPVFFGWEANFDGDEFLIYGLDKKWLLGHPDIMSYSRAEQYDVIHRDNGLVVQAHPFRERTTLTRYILTPKHVTPWRDIIHSTTCITTIMLRYIAGNIIYS